MSEPVSGNSQPSGNTRSPALIRARLVGLAGSVLLAVAGFGAGARPHHNPVGVLPGWGRLAHDPWYAVALLAWLAGTGLLVAGWWLLRRPAAAGALPVRWMLVTVALWAVPLLLAPPLASRDIYAYLAQGDLYAHGLDPYRVGPAALPSRWLAEMSPTWRASTVPYGPLALLAARLAVTASGGHLLVALGLLRLVALVGLLLVAGYLPRLARAAGVNPGAACWLGLGSPVVLVHLVSGAHNDALMIGLLVAGLAYAAERRWLPAGLALGLAGAVKATALVAVPFAVVLVLARFGGRYRFVRAAGAVLAAVLAGFAAVTLAAGLGLGWVSALAGTEASVQWTSVPTGVGMAIGFVLRLVGLPGAAAVLAVCKDVALYVVLPVVLVLVWWPVRRGAAVRDVVARAGWALAALVLAFPTVHPWYPLWAVPVLAAAVPADTAAGVRVRRIVLVVLAVLAFLTLPDGFNLARVTVFVGAPLDVAITVLLAVFGIRLLRSRVAGRKAGKNDRTNGTGAEASNTFGSAPDTARQ